MGEISQIRQNDKWVARFERYTPELRQLYDRLAAEVFPLLVEAGFVRVDAVSRGFTEWTGPNEIVFQKRSEAEWPTVEFELGRRGAAFCKVHLGALPPVCVALGGENVPQAEAPVFQSPVYFTLTRDVRKGPDAQEFGHIRGLFRKSSVEEGIVAIRQLIPFVIQHFEQGYPRAWIGASFDVHPNLLLMSAPWSTVRVCNSIPAGAYYRELL